MRKLFQVLILAFFGLHAHTARAACPWSEGAVLEVEATMTEVRVHGDRYVVSNRNRESFAAILSECGMTNALYSFNRWRDNRRTVNVSAVVTLVGIWPAMFWTIGDAAGAPVHRHRFKVAMEGRE